MASNSMEVPEGSDEKLADIFDHAMKVFKEVENCREPTNSPESQQRVQKCIRMFEDATRLVSLSGVFSSNENVEELSTESLQYLLLPVVLGTLSTKITNRSRRDIVNVCEIYFRDFLQRCKDYGITDVEIPEPKSTDTDVEGKITATQNEQTRLVAMVMNREDKLKKFKEQKALQEQLKTLKDAMDAPNVDDSTKREYFIALIKSYVSQSLDELNSIETEKPLIEYMEKQKLLGNEEEQKKPKRETTPLKPIIITKDAIQKAVYGLGYPSLPVMTVEEFYEQRVQEGSFPGPQTKKGPMSLQDMTEADMENVTDREEEEKERKIEEDDPETLERARNTDEYKDDHRRGWGNRHNRS